MIRIKDTIYKSLGASNHTKDDRAKLDFYATDPQALVDLLEVYPQIVNDNFKYLEPCAGEGNLSDKFYELTGIKMDTYDIISRREDIIQANYIDLDVKDKYNCIITNFPYGESTSKNPVGFSELVTKAIDDVKMGGYVCSFQKLLQLESGCRFEKIYSKFKPEAVFVYKKRIGCWKNNDQSKQDKAVCYSWVIWHKTENIDKIKTQLSWI